MLLHCHLNEELGFPSVLRSESWRLAFVEALAGSLADEKQRKKLLEEKPLHDGTNQKATGDIL